MPTTTRPPTANETPDSTQGGGFAAVTGNINTGHGSTSVLATGGKTCRWSGFQSVVGKKLSVTLKVDWSENGTVSTGNNQFVLQYSTNGGGSWSALFQHVGVTASNSGTAQASLSVGQDFGQVQVRDLLEVLANDATITCAISNIRLEVVTQAANIIVMQ